MPQVANLEVSWGQCGVFMERIIEHILAEGFVPSRIVAVAKGGVIPAALVWQVFPDAEFVVLRTKHYGPEGKTAKVEVNARIGEMSNWDSPTTLIVDDICDSGDTFMELHKWMAQSCYAAMCVRHKDTFECDYYGYIIGTDAWVVFPWESNFVPTGLTPSGAAAGKEKG